MNEGGIFCFFYSYHYEIYIHLDNIKLKESTSKKNLVEST